MQPKYVIHTCIRDTRRYACECIYVGEHGGWYEKTAKELNKHDVIAVAHDHVGHGKSEGARMDLTDFEIYVRDTWQVAGAVVEDTKSEQLPLFFVGHSMGGAIAIETTNGKPEKVQHGAFVRQSDVV